MADLPTNSQFSKKQFMEANIQMISVSSADWPRIASLCVRAQFETNKAITIIAFSDKHPNLVATTLHDRPY